jgi:hypothetical protein
MKTSRQTASDNGLPSTCQGMPPTSGRTKNDDRMNINKPPNMTILPLFEHRRKLCRSGTTKVCELFKTTSVGEDQWSNDRLRHAQVLQMCAYAVRKQAGSGGRLEQWRCAIKANRHRSDEAKGLSGQRHEKTRHFMATEIEIFAFDLVPGARLCS